MSEQEEKQIVLVACRRGNDQVTRGESCDSRRAYKLAPDGTQNALYKCCKCGFSWNVPLGGAFTAC